MAVSLCSPLKILKVIPNVFLEIYGKVFEELVFFGMALQIFVIFGDYASQKPDYRIICLRGGNVLVALILGTIVPFSMIANKGFGLING